jgi:N-acetylneuraminic acid mutarotase
MIKRIAQNLICYIYFILFTFLLKPLYTMQLHDKPIIDLNGELDKKLDDLFSYYKNAIQSTKNSPTNINIFDEIKSSADKILFKEPNLPDFAKISFLESSSTIDSKQVFFNYQPFVWTELTTKNEGPIERRGHSSLIADTYMIVFGGCYMESKCYNDLFFLDLRSQQWIAVPTSGKVPSARQGHSAVLYGSTMWVYGGSSSEGYLSDLYSLNLETREWKQHFFTGAQSKGRAGHGAVLDNESKMMIFGGYSDAGYSNDFFTINILEERFENPLTSGNKPSGRENFSMEIVNSRIFIFGGFQEGGVLNDMYSLDLITLTWETLQPQGPTPPQAQGMASCRVGKKIYITSGCDYRKQSCYTDTYIFDLDTLWWTKIENK